MKELKWHRQRQPKPEKTVEGDQDAHIPKLIFSNFTSPNLWYYRSAFARSAQIIWNREGAKSAKEN
ncbi:MAG: hypothetical protein COY47_00115 [Chloroflexi bacterium CG_4_10_14_0_8_um_filter_57_5]|nr:MAG: hypothetical protein COY47_00115 [Chloroflexi bacterium CG_4_10_14_0_8_um_filter_57_5]